MERLYKDYYSHVVLPFVNGRFREIHEQGCQEHPEHALSWQDFSKKIDDKAIESFRYNFMKLKEREWKKGMIVRHEGYGRHAFKYFDFPEKLESRVKLV